MDMIPTIREFMAKELLQTAELDVAADIPLIDEGYLTSLQTVELVMFLEEQFQAHLALAQFFTPSGGVELTPEQLQTLRTLGYMN